MVLKGWKMHLKILVSLSLIFLGLGASEIESPKSKQGVSLIDSFKTFSIDDSYLSSYKKEQIKIDKKRVELQSDNLKYDWISSIMGSASYTNSDSLGYTKETLSASITIDQPIFKSGGIWYAIKYAGANREFLRLGTEQNQLNLLKSVISYLFQIKKYEMQILKQKLLIKNSNIDVMRKKEQYESGLLDSSFLDSAILDRSRLEIALLDLESQKHSIVMKFKSISDLDYKSTKLPKFMLIKKSTYLDSLLSLKSKRAEEIKNRYLKKMTVSNYLPTVSFFAGYYAKKDSFNGMSQSSDYNQFGLRFSMPLYSVNKSRDIEIKQLDLLKSKLEYLDLKRDEENTYTDSVERLKILDKKIEIVKRNEKLYASLLSATKESYSAGEKTIYDVNTLKNSMKTTSLDIKIYELDKQMILLELYAKMNGEI